MLPEFSPYNPFRELHWRWLRAQNVVNGGPKVSQRGDDIWVKRTVPFQKELQNCKTPLDYGVLSMSQPDIYWAYTLFSRRETEEHRIITHALEARILAAQDREEIVARLGIERAVITAYEALFFDVEAKRQNTDYIRAKVLKDAISRGIRERQYDLFWKMAALQGGPILLEAVMAGTMAIAMPQTPDDLGRYLKDKFSSNATLKAVAALTSVDARSDTLQPILETYFKLRALETLGAGGNRTQDSVVENLRTLFAGIEFSVGRSDQAGKAMPGADLGCELTGHELTAASLGKPVEIDPIWQTASFQVVSADDEDGNEEVPT